MTPAFDLANPATLIKLALSCFGLAGVFLLWLVWAMKTVDPCDCPTHVLRSQTKGFLVVKVFHQPGCRYHGTE